MNGASMNSKNVMNNVGILFNDSVVINIVLENNTGMNNDFQRIFL